MCPWEPYIYCEEDLPSPAKLSERGHETAFTETELHQSEGLKATKENRLSSLLILLAISWLVLEEGGFKSIRLEFYCGWILIK